MKVAYGTRVEAIEKGLDLSYIFESKGDRIYQLKVVSEKGIKDEFKVLFRAMHGC